MYAAVPGFGRIWYERAGAGAPLLLLHPVGLDGGFWGEVAAGLAAEHTIYAVDLRGHGRSDRPAAPFGVEDLARDIVALCRALALDAPVLCGQSLGGMVAQAVALAEPCLPAALVLADTTASPDPALMEARARAIETGGMAAMVEETLDRWLTADTRAKRPELVGRFRARLLADDAHTQALMWRAMAGFSAADRLAGIRMPCLVVSGDQDASAPPASARAMAGRIPGARYLEIADASHMAAFERPDAFARGVRTFLGGARGSRRGCDPGRCRSPSGGTESSGGRPILAPRLERGS